MNGLAYTLIYNSFTSNYPQEEFGIVTTMSDQLSKNIPTSLLQALEYCKTLEDNWNGFDAKKPSSLVIENIRKFIESLPHNKCVPDHLSPDGEGGITLKWLKPDQCLLLNFEPWLIHAAFEKNNEQPIFLDDIIYLAVGGVDNMIPQEILHYIPNR